jgi:hypothetical protein
MQLIWLLLQLMGHINLLMDENLIYNYKLCVCAFVHLTRQFCILIQRQNRGVAFSMAEPVAVRGGGTGEGGPAGRGQHGGGGGPASNQTKIQFFLKTIFIIEHIKKNYNLFEK